MWTNILKQQCFKKEQHAKINMDTTTKFQLRAIVDKMGKFGENGCNLAGADTGRVAENKDPARNLQVLMKPW